MVAILDLQSEQFLAISDLPVAPILPSFKLTDLSIQEKHKIEFQDGGYCGFLIETIFYLQVALILPTKFQVNWPFGSGEEAQNDFQDGCHLGFLIQTILPTLNL